MSATVDRANQEKVKDRKEEILKSVGLRDVKVLLSQPLLLSHPLTTPFRTYFGR